MIPAGYTELKNAYKKHFKTGNEETNESHFLILFYAIECGLKSIYLRRNRLNKTSDIRNPNLQGTHDITRFIRELHLSPDIASKISVNFRLKRDTTEQYHVQDVHQAWRYGIVLNENNKDELVEGLKEVGVWIKDNINKR